MSLRDAFAELIEAEFGGGTDAEPLSHRLTTDAWLALEKRMRAALAASATPSDPTVTAARTATALCEIVEIIRALNTEVAAWRACARHDPDMSGKGQFKGWDRSALDRCRKQFIEGRHEA
jgi:hypothetical protein